MRVIESHGLIADYLFCDFREWFQNNYKYIYTYTYKHTHMCVKAKIYICLKQNNAAMAHVEPQADKLTEVVQAETKGDSENVSSCESAES